MRPSEQFNQRGLTAARYCLSLAAGRGDLQVAAKTARLRYGDTITRSVVPSGGVPLDSDTWGLELALPTSGGQEIVALADEVSVFGRLKPTMRAIPRNVRCSVQTARALAGWVPAGMEIGVALMGFDPLALDTNKLAGIIVTSNELAQSATAQAETMMRKDLVAATVELTDSALLDPSQAAIEGTQPASLSYGVTPITSSGNPATDIAELVAAFPGDLGQAIWVCSPTTAARIALFRDAGGAFPFLDCGIRGGSILNAPLICSNSVPVSSEGDWLGLIDPTAIAYTEGDLDISSTRQAMLKMHAAPGDESEPVAVSLFQAESTAIKIIRPLSWKVARACCSWMWANYSPASSSGS